MSAPTGDEQPRDYDDALPGAQTELAPSASGTEAHTAWALDDEPEWRTPFWTPGRITAVVAGVSTALVAAAAVVGFVYLHDRQDAASVPAANATPTSIVALPPPPPVTVTTVVVQPPPKTITAAPSTVRVQAPPVVERTIPTPSMATYDQRLLNRLGAAGFTIWDPGAVANQAHSVCRALSQGEQPAQIVAELTGPGSPTSIGEAQIYVTAVMAVYPQCGQG
ncbi:DUF732 domain-containing protein [Mycolicibacterium fluoranthenivorans]|uniref:DUF732 domain-containing protein n=1 Tax=Mycolicibacterium fluoranthenivorans TaxID=258505 RepID=A0A7G8PAR9_9MYCO|nr:DUF732 domain-containing protein [Mycolicibacterium fluoranthenivorans]QNJ91435.1 DUF732 domain-containing protein [Mycolicibacterium fluoranthenivorans]